MKKGLKKPIALLLSAMMIFSTSASAFPAMAEDNLIFGKAENNSIHSDYESEITVTTCENEENPLETETTTVSTTTEVSVQSIEEQTESNPVEVYNSDYAVYAVSSNEYEQPEGDGTQNNPYQISNSSQLFWFAKQVNDKGNTSINAVLTTNIVVNKNVLNGDGTLNSSSTLTEWTPIGNNSKKYTGTFDGKNHTISGLYFNDNTNYVGLFGWNYGTIKNVGIIDSYFKGNYYVGAVCGYNDNGSTIENSYNTGTINGSSYYVGGVCGYNNNGTIENSYNTGSVSGANYVGGVCGHNYNGNTIENSYNTGSVSGSGKNVGGVCGCNSSSSTIRNSYNTGSVSGSNQIGGVCGNNNYGGIENSYNTGSVSGSEKVGGVCGINSGTTKNSYNTGSVSGANYVGGVCGYNPGRNSTIADSYYNNSVYSGEAVGINTGTVNKVSGKTSEQFASGEVAYLLGEIWGQKIGKDKLPVLNGKKVYENKTYTGCCEKYQGDITYVYSNTQKDAVYLKETHNFKNGICTGCGTYEPPELKDGYYQIENVNHLYWFAKQVNNVDTKINAVLTADIVVNKNVLNADGTLNKSLTNLIEWTPIGNSSNKYTGIFDGQNHTISGLYFNNSTNCVGLFGYNSGTIKNVGMIDSYFKGKDYVSDVCAINYGTIESSYNASTVSGSKWVGGICAVNYATIKDSYNTGSVSGSNQIGGVCGHNFTKDTMTTPCIIENIYNTGSVSGSGNYVGGVCGINDTNCTVINSYNTGSVSGSGNYVGAVCGYNSGTIKSNYYLENCNADGTKFTNNYGTKKTAEQFASGEVAYLLGGIWGQEIGTDKLPVLNGKKVYQNIIYSGCCKEYQGDITYDYSNTQKDAVYLKETHNFINGICTGCGTYEPAPLVDNYYQISNAGNLLWFAQQVNNGNVNINAILTANIVVNTNVLNADGTLVTGFEKLRIWTPIGNVSNQYTGTFDGNNHTISGLYFNDNTNYVGLFGWNYGTIKNVGIIDSYFNGKNYVGGVCGYNWNGTIENSYNTGSVSGSGNSVGGVCGYNYDSNSKIENSYNTGLVSGAEDVGGVCGSNSGTIKNSYYLENCNADGKTFTNSYGITQTSKQFASGEVAYLLGGIWGQKIGTDKLPVLNSENKVIYSILENETSSSESYINASGTVTAPIKEGYNFKGWYTYDESNNNHYTGDVICSSREYNNSNVTADSKIVAVYTSLGTASITINCDRAYTINGVSKSSATTESYPIGSKITLSCDNADFAYWQNSAGTILSRESEYSFVVTNAETISAVFNEIVDNKVTLIFESFYGQVIATKQLANGETIDTDTISVPIRTGYNALGWDFDGDGKYDKNKDTLESAIARGFESDSRTVRIVQVYELINENHKITVENGTGSGTYNQNDIVTATPNEAETGMKFSHWEDSKGNILSYNEKYVFYVSEDLTIKAVYVETETKVDAKGTTGIVTFGKKPNNKLSFVSMSTVPEGCKINKAGIIATNKSEVANSGEFTDKNAMFVRGMSSDKKAVRYTWTKGNVKSGETWYVRAYLVYTDSNGNVHTVYGDMVSQEY